MQSTDGERGLAKAAYQARNDVQRCIVCGRWFVKRKDRVCSIACQQRAEAREADAPQ